MRGFTITERFSLGDCRCYFEKQIDNNFHGVYSCQPYSRPRNDVKMFRKIRAVILLVATPPLGNFKTFGVFPFLFFCFCFLSFYVSFFFFFFKIVFFLILNAYPRSRTIITTGCFADCAKIFPIFVFNYHNTCVVCCRSVWKAYVI